MAVGNKPSATYTLFDIPTKAPRVCWSMNTWRSRSAQTNPSQKSMNAETNAQLDYF